MYYLFQNIFCQGSNSTLTSSCNENINQSLSVYFLAFICCHFKISNLRITHLLYQASVELFYLKHFFISFCFTYFELIDFWIESCKKVNSRPVYCLFLGENIIGRDVACKICIPLKVNMFMYHFLFVIPDWCLLHNTIYTGQGKRKTYYSMCLEKVHH